MERILPDQRSELYGFPLIPLNGDSLESSECTNIVFKPIPSFHVSFRDDILGVLQRQAKIVLWRKLEIFHECGSYPEAADGWGGPMDRRRWGEEV